MPIIDDIEPDGRVVVGGFINIRIPLDGPEPSAPVLSDQELRAIWMSEKGQVISFPSPRALPLTNGGYATVSSLMVSIYAEEGRSVVKVLDVVPNPPAKRKRGRPRLSHEHLLNVAEVFNAAEFPRVPAVADAFGLTYKTAVRHISRCRAEGLIRSY